MSAVPTNKTERLAALPSEWPDDLLPAIQQQVAASHCTVVVLDDDPTGTQTVHDIPVLTTWPVELLRAELQNDLSAFYILTNSRSLSLPDAQALNHEIGHNLIVAAQQAERAFVVISRSDSTLRGHFPGETDALADALAQQFDGVVLMPFFEEGERYTIDDVHCVADDDELVPVADTPFARDAVFGFRSSNLRAWVAEKTNGRIAADAVLSISLNDIRQGGPERVLEQLATLRRGRVCVVNAASMRDLYVVTHALLRAEAQGKHFLYRTAASFVQARVGLTPQPLLDAARLNLPTAGGGLIVVGSYVPATTRQLDTLFAQTTMERVEIDVQALLNDNTAQRELARATQKVNQALRSGDDVVLVTSRQLVTDAATTERNVAIGQRVSQGLVAVVQALITRPRYIVAKGGITSSDVATKGLNVHRALVRGQILPGVPMWQLGAESRFPGIVYVVFPGNVGGSRALADLVTLLQRKA
jgi:uncharacterized protein YgbK (DUF1537 family)